MIKNPFDTTTNKNLMGERVVKTGPTVLYLRYGEILESKSKVYVLKKNQAIRLQSLQDHKDELDGTDKPSGFIWQVEGPCKFIPNKYTKVIKTVDAILIEPESGIYVQSIETNEKKLVVGPCAYLLNATEELYIKAYSDLEAAALSLSPYGSSEATVIRLQKGQVICVLDIDKHEKIICGPGSYILGPDEVLKVLNLSGGKPKVPRQIIAAKIELGPAFMSDLFEVRTKDNAALRLLLTYKWQFLVNEKESYLAFSLPDFVGYICNTLCSKIREEAAKYLFEEFHTNTVAIIRKSLFRDVELVHEDGVKENAHGLLFDEIKLLISEVDVKSVDPSNPEINRLLNQSIKSNMRIVCQKLELEASLNAQKESIKEEANIQKLRESFIDIQNENFSLDKVEKAKIEGAALIEEAKAKKEAHVLKETAKLHTQLYKMQKTIELLDSEAGDRYLEYLKVMNMKKIPQSWFINTDSKVSLGLM